MDSLSLVFDNLLSPPVIAFVAGLTARMIRSDLSFPEPVYQGLTLYLLLVIGFKGGTSLSHTTFDAVLAPALGILFLGTVIPVAVYFVGRGPLRLENADAAAIAAHYGSVSAVTFMACLAFLQAHGRAAEPFMPALMSLLEFPALCVSLVLARMGGRGVGSWWPALREVAVGRSMVLLITGLLAGAVAGPQAYNQAKPFLIDPFYGVLVFFLLEMGLVAGSRLREFRSAGPRLVAFALTAPLVQGTLGLFVARAVGLSEAGAIVMATMAASASYIAAPATVRMALPEANPAYYVTTSLGLTFPFNLTLGIPIYYGLARLIYQA